MVIQLQGIGKQKAIEAKDLKPGMITVWNYGYKETIKSIEFSKTGKTLRAIIISESGRETERRLKADRLVGIA